MLTKATALAAALAATAFAGTAQAQDAGDPEAGEKVFRKCQACHVVEEEQNRVGPHLNGVVGREVAAVEDYSYSDAMVEWGDGKVWDAETLDSYLENPKGVVEGTKMNYPGLKKAEERADVIAYLESVPAAE